MRAPLALLCFSLLLALLLVVSGSGLHSANPAVEFPSGGPQDPEEAAMAQLVLQSCGGCHGITRLASDPQNLAGWRSEIARMQQLGARVPQGEEEELAQYLTRRFGTSQ